MRYGYACHHCGAESDGDYPIGKAPATRQCPACKQLAKRAYSCNFVLKGGGWPSKGISLNREMTARNERAGRRMRKEHKPGMKLAALDYGGGDVREVK